MVVGYAGFYLCRSNLSATMPLIIDDLAARGMDPDAAKDRLGVGRLAGDDRLCPGQVRRGEPDRPPGRAAELLDRHGRRGRLHVRPRAGGLAAGLHAGLVRQPADPVAGLAGDDQDHVAMVLVFGYGTVMGVISLSFLFGDAAARAFIGWLIDAGLGWRGVFWVAAGVLAVLWVVNAALIRESPERAGPARAGDEPGQSLRRAGRGPAPRVGRPALATLARSPAFWIVCLMSLGLTFLRETFNNWTPTYLVQGVGLSKGDGGRDERAVPVLRRGLGDPGGLPGRPLRPRRPGGDHPGRDLLCAAGAGGARLGQLRGPVARGAGAGRAVAFLLIGPYSYLAGAISLDFGGKRGGATACGIIDGVGYLFGGVRGRQGRRQPVASRWAGRASS